MSKLTNIFIDEGYDLPLCPFCCGINTAIDDEGYCLCFDCNACWKEEDFL